MLSSTIDMSDAPCFSLAPIDRNTWLGNIKNSYNIRSLLSRVIGGNTSRML